MSGSLILNELLALLEKKHVFANANKRIALLVLVKFIQLKGYHFSVTIK